MNQTSALLTFSVEGLDCANCASKLERKIAQLSEVASVAIDFAAGRLLITPKDAVDLPALTEKLNATADAIEPGITISPARRGAARAAQSPAQHDNCACGDGHAHESHTHEHAHGEHCGCGSESHSDQAAQASVMPADVAPKSRRLSDRARASLILWIRVGAAVVLAVLGNVLPLPGSVAIGFHVAGWLIIGYDILLRTFQNIRQKEFFDENLLMSVATIGALCIGETTDALAVMIFYQIGEWLQGLAVHRSRENISAMLQLQPETTNLLVDGAVRVVQTEAVPMGSHILIRAGEKVPLDGVVAEGRGSFDTAALTGESLPRDLAAGDAVLAGYISLSGTVQVETTKTSDTTVAAGIQSLFEEASLRKAPTEAFITKFARVYTPIVFAIAVLLAAIPPLFFGQDFATYLYRALTFLVISCPCALILSVPLSFFGGMGGAARRGIMVKGGNALEALSHADTIAFDKTGTLTTGVFTVTSLSPADGVSEDRLLQTAAKAEAGSAHPVAQSILRAANYSGAPHETTEHAGLGLEASIDRHTVLAGNAALMAQNGIDAPARTSAGTLVHVAEDGRYLGCITIEDVPHKEAAATVQGLKRHGVRQISMFTGDRREAAEQVAGSLGIDDVRAGLLPDGKLTELETMLDHSGGRTVAFVGDGLNDAPVLARADVGIAMARADNHIATSAADIVVLSPSPAKVLDAFRIAKKTNRIVRENVIFALGVKAAVLVLAAFGYAPMWSAVFADVGVALLAVLNALRTLRLKERF